MSKKATMYLLLTMVDNGFSSHTHTGHLMLYITVDCASAVQQWGLAKIPQACAKLIAMKQEKGCIGSSWRKKAEQEEAPAWPGQNWMSGTENCSSRQNWSRNLQVTQAGRGMRNMMMQSDSIPQEQEGLHKYIGLLHTDVTQASAEWNTHTSTCTSEKKEAALSYKQWQNPQPWLITICNFSAAAASHHMQCKLHRNMAYQTVQLWSKVDWNVPHLGTGIGLINLSSPLHRKARPSALFISSTSHTNQTNPIWQQPMPTHGKGSKNLKNFFLANILVKRMKKREDQTKPP